MPCIICTKTVSKVFFKWNLLKCWGHVINVWSILLKAQTNVLETHDYATFDRQEYVLLPSLPVSKDQPRQSAQPSGSGARGEAAPGRTQNDLLPPPPARLPCPGPSSPGSNLIATLAKHRIVTEDAPYCIRCRFHFLQRPQGKTILWFQRHVLPPPSPHQDPRGMLTTHRSCNVLM